MLDSSAVQNQSTQQGQPDLPTQPLKAQRETSAQLPAISAVHPIPAAPLGMVRPEQLIRRKTPAPPKNPLARIHFFWRKDPAYKVLILVIGVVLLAGLILSSVVWLRNPLSLSQVPYTQNGATVDMHAGKVDYHPTFAPPGGGRGSSSSSQPPMQSTPSLQPTPTPNPIVGLTVQLSSIPSQVRDFSKVLVGVTTNEANVTVTLLISYNAPPYKGSAGPRITDESGSVSIPWHVQVFDFKHLRDTATVTAIAVDQHGQRAQSQTVTVKVFNGL